MRGTVAFLIVIAVFASGCAESLNDYVSAVQRKNDPASPPAPILGGGDRLTGIKVSAGQLRAAGSTMGMDVTVSPTQKTVVGSTIGMRVGISRSR